MLLDEIELDWKTIVIYSCILFAVQLLGHLVPKMVGMGEKGEKWTLICFFGLCLGVAFNITIPGSLHVVTDAWEAYSNATKEVEIDLLFNTFRRLDDDDDDDDDSFRRIIGVAICVGFMLMFLADYISKGCTKKSRKDSVALPLADGAEQKLPAYTNGSLVNLFIVYYIFAAVGCMGAYLVCDNKHQRVFILIAQAICMIPPTIIYGMQMIRQKNSPCVCGSARSG